MNTEKMMQFDVLEMEALEMIEGGSWADATTATVSGAAIGGGLCVASGVAAALTGVCMYTGAKVGWGIWAISHGLSKR